MHVSESNTGAAFSQDELRELAKKKVLQHLALKIHVAAFILANAGMLLINYMTNGLALPWFVYPLAGWFIGLVAHLAAYYAYSRGITLVTTGIMINAAAYLASVVGLLAINVVASPLVPWFLWPAIFWGAGVICHWVAIRTFATRQEPDGEKKSWLERSADKELARASKRKGVA